MAEPIHATPAEARAWERNLRKTAPPPAAVPPPLAAACQALDALVASSQAEAHRATTPAGLSYWQGHTAGVAQARAILTDLAEQPGE